MLIYFLKVVLLSGLFYSIYYFLLSREKSFKFNRFYLLGTLLLSYLIPFIKIPVEGQKRVVVGELVEVANFNQAAANINPTALTQSSSVDYLLIFYAIITLILVLKFVFNLYSILRIKGNLVVFKGIRLLKAHQKIPPFSFLNTMYLNKDDFKSLDDKIWIQILNDRNLTSHIYKEEIADEICERIIKTYFQEFKALSKRLAE